MKLLSRFGILFAAIAILQSGCSESPGGGGIGGTGKVVVPVERGLVIGSINGFGSVIINGNRYDTDDAVVMNDGQVANLSDLEVGMYVSARVNLEDSVATTVEYQPVLKGPVQSVSIGSFTILVNQFL